MKRSFSIILVFLLFRFSLAQVQVVPGSLETFNFFLQPQSTFRYGDVILYQGLIFNNSPDTIINPTFWLQTQLDVLGDYAELQSLQDTIPPGDGAIIVGFGEVTPLMFRGGGGITTVVVWPALHDENYKYQPVYSVFDTVNVTILGDVLNPYAEAFPNPCTDVLHLRYEQYYIPTSVHVKMTNVYGTQLIETDDRIREIDMRDCPSGLYMLEITTNHWIYGERRRYYTIRKE